MNRQICMMIIGIIFLATLAYAAGATPAPTESLDVKWFAGAAAGIEALKK